MKPSRLLPRRTRERLNINRHRIAGFVRDSAAAIPDGARVLDAGAGEGRYREHFTRHEYVAADLAVGDADWDYSGLSTVCDLHRLPFGRGAFDVVVATQVLEHLREPARFVAEIHDVLRPGGLVLITAPMMFREHQTPHDYFRFTRYGLRSLLETAGFDRIEIEPQGGFFSLMGDLLQACHRYLFPRTRSLVSRILFSPLEVVSKVFFSVLAPLVCIALDRFDRKRIYTTGFECSARRPGADAS